MLLLDGEPYSPDDAKRAGLLVLDGTADDLAALAAAGYDLLLGY